MISLNELVAEIDAETGGKAATQTLRLTGTDAPDQTDRRSERRQFIRFVIGDVLLALPISNALEIGHVPRITPLPNLPDWILGVSNIRGEIISMTDLKGFFGMPSQGLKRDSRYIILRHEETKIGAVVDGILGIFYPDRTEARIQKSPYVKGEITAFISGVVSMEGTFLNMLDVEKLFTSKRMTAFRID